MIQDYWEARKKRERKGKEKEKNGGWTSNGGHRVTLIGLIKNYQGQFCHQDEC